MYKDKPIEREEDDELGRLSFANSLADYILKWRNEESWVIALTGDWGIGKTSVKNLMSKRIKRNDESMLIIDFQPWEWSSQDLILDAFFRELANTLEIKGKSTFNKNLAEKLRNYNYYLNNIKAITNPTIKILPIVLGAILGGSFFISSKVSNTSTEAITNLIVSILAIWLVFFEGLGGLLKSVIDRNDYLASENKKSIVELKKDISESLSQLNQPILIIIDDIDRLERHQILTIMQLVKSNADFKNVIFLLLYSKSVLESKIEDDAQTGHEYMEKIIQAEFKVPEPDSMVLNHYFIDKLNIILDKVKGENFEKIFDNSYFTEVFHRRGLTTYFTNLRSVYKFLNSFQFNILSQFKDGYLEVNLTDFMVLETFRIFEPKLYNAIYNNKTLMLGELNNINHLITIPDEEKTRIATDFLEENSNEISAALLETIFPAFYYYLGTTFDLNSPRDKFIKNMISHKEIFDRYFTLSHSTNSITTYETIKFFNNLVDTSITNNYLDSIYISGKFDSFIQNTTSYIHELPEDLIHEYFQALLHLYNLADDGGMISEKIRVRFLLTDSLKAFPNMQFDILNKLATIYPQSSLVCEIYGSISDKPYDYNLDTNELNHIHKLIAENIEEFVKQDLDTFINYYHRLTLLWFWYNYDKTSCISCINSLFNQSSTFFKISSIFIRTQITTSNLGTSEQIYLDKEATSEFISLEDFETLLLTNIQDSEYYENLRVKELFYAPKLDD